MVSFAPGKGGQSQIPNLRSKLRHSRPKLGQHFLHDSGYRARILRALSLTSSDVVFEIGPGKGAMTALLAERVRKVLAIEIDRALVQKLQEQVPDPTKVEIIPADVLEVDFAALCNREGIVRGIVFGNIPYYITSPILHHLLDQRRSIQAMALLMQREVADRLTAEPGTRDYGYLTVAIQTYSQPEIALFVPPGAFSPPPKVQSALVTFSIRPKFEHWTDEVYDRFLSFAKHCFGQKRKNLLNNLQGRFARDRLVEALERIGKASNVRAEQLSVKELASIFEFLTPDGTESFVRSVELTK